MNENTRRYYLDAMGVQCWQLITPAESSQSPNDSEILTHNALDLEINIQQCQQCERHNTRKQALPGHGNLSAKLMFIVLSAGSDDDSNCTLCSGEAGALFTKMLAAINIDIKDVYLSSLLKCAVAENHTITPQEIDSCNQYLQQQTQLIQPSLIIALGETTLRCLLQKELSIDDFRAQKHTLPELASVPLLVSYSPQELIDRPENKRKAWLDLQDLQKLITGIDQ